MAGRAIGGESRRRVGRIRGGLVVCAMAADAFGGRSRIPVRRSARVAFLAFKRRMFAEEREPGCLMFLTHIGDFPGLHAVAPHAVGAQFRSMDVRMAGGTSFIHPGELQRLVTAHAVGGRMLSLKRESGC